MYKRFTPAGPDHAQIAASAGIADYVDLMYAHHFSGVAAPAARCEAVHDLMRARENMLLQPLLDYLGEKNSVRLIGPRDASARAPTAAVELAGSGEAAAAALAAHGIMAGGGDFYGVRPLDAIGIDPGKGVLRLSFVHYTSAEEVDRLIGALDRVL